MEIGNAKMIDLLSALTPQQNAVDAPSSKKSPQTAELGFAAILGAIVIDPTLQSTDMSAEPVVQNGDAASNASEFNMIGQLPGFDVAAIGPQNDENRTPQIIPEASVNVEMAKLFEKSNGQPSGKINGRDLLFQSTDKSLNSINDLTTSLQPALPSDASKLEAPLVVLNGEAVTNLAVLDKPIAEINPNSFQLQALNVKEIRIDLKNYDSKQIIETHDLRSVISGQLKTEGTDNSALLIKSFSPPQASTESVNLSLNTSIDRDLIKSQDDGTESESNSQFESKSDDAKPQPRINNSDGSAESNLNEKVSSKRVNSESDSIFDSRNSVSKELVKQQFDETKSSQSVKIILPENTKLSGSQQHQSIMIKFEPEHLGPARLDLHLKNDLFTARLTVDSPEAKSILENSLSNLREQLSKADIQIERIEINVRGETSQNQLFERQPHWQRFNAHNNIRPHDDDLVAAFVPVNRLSGQFQGQYVGRDGVNVLA